MIYRTRSCYDPAMRLTLIVALVIASPLLAQSSPQNVQRQRQELVTSILTKNEQHTVEAQRWVCINGQEPGRVKEARSDGAVFTPDAYDACLATLQRSARENWLDGIYKKFLTNLNGDATGSSIFPRAVGAAVLSGNGKVPIGHELEITVSTSLAFDAGFSAAYTQSAPKKDADPQKLRAIAEGCLNAQGDPGTCFSVGFVLGSQAVNAR